MGKSTQLYIIEVSVAPMTPPAQPRNIPKCKKWHVNRIEEEMGEIYYYISRNDEHFAVAPSEEIANFIITSCSRPAPSPDVTINFDDTSDYEFLVGWMKANMIRSGDEALIRGLMRRLRAAVTNLHQ